jgi:hypothetical protein
MRPGDPPGHLFVIVRDVGRRIASAMLEFDGKAAPELLHVEARLRPVDPDALADRASLLEMARAAAVLVA